jgi:quercetin dioxygenase-like cupin family protein
MKRTLLLGVLVLLAAFLLASSAYAKVVVIDVDKNKTAIAVSQPDVTMIPVPKIGEEACKGFQYGTYATSDDKNVGIHRLVMEPNGNIATHASPQWYVCVILKGKGTLVLTDANKKPTSTVEFAPGDVLVFKPNTMHYWKNGPEETVMLGVSKNPQ